MFDLLSRELVHEILLQLPVKTLALCKCVSRELRNIINDTDFIKIHFDRSNTITPTLFLLHNTDDYLLHLDLHDIYASGLIESCSFPDNTYRRFPSLVGSCNGLICKMNQRYSTGEFLIFNPSIRRHYVLSFRLPKKFFSLDGYGFGYGYHKEKGNYKIVRIVTLYDDHRFKFKIFIYNVETESIKDLEMHYTILDATLYASRMGVLVNGTLHWLATKCDKPDVSVIMALDLGTEDTYGLPLPESSIRNDCDIFNMNLGVLRTWLCLSYANRCNSDAGTEVWVMKEHGAEESWTKLFSISENALPTMYANATTPLVFSTSGREILLNVSDHRLVWYETENNKAVDITIPGVQRDSLIDTIVCLRSLVPPDANVVGIHNQQQPPEEGQAMD